MKMVIQRIIRVVYRNNKYDVACLISDTGVQTIANALNNLLQNNVYHERLQQNCLNAREELNWQKEEGVLIDFYKKLFI